MRVNSRRTSRNKRLGIFIVGAALLVSLLIFVPYFFGTVASFTLRPIVVLESWIAQSGKLVPQYFVDRSTLIGELKALEARVANESGTQHTIKRLQSENSELKQQLTIEDDTRIGASIIGRPTVTPYDVLVLDKGARDGIEKSAPVYIGIDQVIGYVAEVFPRSSVVTLLSTPNFESTVYIIGPNIYTTAVGLGGGVLKISVPQGIPLTVGDLVVLPALGTGVFGSIEVVDSIPTEPEQRGYVTFSMPLQSMRFVTVGESAAQPLSFEEAVEVVGQTKSDLAKVPVPSGILVDINDEVEATSTATTTEEVEVIAEE